MFLFLGVLSASHYMAGAYQQSLETVNFAVRRFPWYASTHRWHAVALAQLGRLDEATSALGEFLGLSPSYTLEIARHSYPFRRQSDLAHYLDGLRKAAGGDRLHAAVTPNRPGGLCLATLRFRFPANRVINRDSRCFSGFQPKRALSLRLEFKALSAISLRPPTASLFLVNTDLVHP
jgi:tetratricopeptide (TPR) repeat protein